MLQKLIKEKFEEESRCLSGRVPKRESDLGEFLVPPPEGDSEALRTLAILNLEF